MEQRMHCTGEEESSGTDGIKQSPGRTNNSYESCKQTNKQTDKQTKTPTHSLNGPPGVAWAHKVSDFIVGVHELSEPV